MGEGEGRSEGRQWLWEEEGQNRSQLRAALARGPKTLRQTLAPMPKCLQHVPPSRDNADLSKRSVLLNGKEPVEAGMLSGGCHLAAWEVEARQSQVQGLCGL